MGLEEGILAILQTYYDIRIEKEKQQTETPNLALLRNSLFWDTAIEHIDWKKQYKAVIKRIFERGNETEKSEIIRFYGKQKVDDVLNSISRKPYTLSAK